MQLDNAIRQMMESIYRMMGSACEKETLGDYRDEEDLLICHRCGTRKEKRQDIPYLGIRTYPCLCDCQRERIRIKEENAAKAQEQQRAQAAVKEMRRFSLIDKKFEESTFDRCIVTPENSYHVKLAKRYVEKFPEMLRMNKGLLFHGETGTGKTFIASCIANSLMDNSVPVFFTSMLKLTSATSPFSREAEERAVMLDKMNLAKLVVIDDIGTERETEYKMEQVFEVIDARYSVKLPMIVTTNTSIETMRRETNVRKKRIYERIYECCFPVAFAGTSWRTRKAAEDFDLVRNLLNDT